MSKIDYTKVTKELMKLASSHEMRLKLHRDVPSSTVGGVMIGALTGAGSHALTDLAFKRTSSPKELALLTVAGAGAGGLTRYLNAKRFNKRMNRFDLVPSKNRTLEDDV